LLDFREAGDLGVFIDAQGVQQREQTLGKSGMYPGAELGFVFQTLRANDLIWPNVINNYFEGQAARGLRPAVLERRRDQPARADVRLGTCATCTSRTTCACRTS
jgi:poly(3-hydroxyalkanoate) synthetase